MAAGRKVGGARARSGPQGLALDASTAPGNHAGAMGGRSYVVIDISSEN